MHSKFYRLSIHVSWGRKRLRCFIILLFSCFLSSFLLAVLLSLRFRSFSLFLWLLLISSSLVFFNSLLLISIKVWFSIFSSSKRCSSSRFLLSSPWTFFFKSLHSRRDLRAVTSSLSFSSSYDSSLAFSFASHSSSTGPDLATDLLRWHLRGCSYH